MWHGLNATGLKTTLHGFRASFRSWAMENGHDFAASELCLGHVIGNTVVQAYARTDLLEQRRTIMVEWGDYVTRRR